MATGRTCPYVTICFGWLGCEERQLQRYADMHTVLGALKVYKYVAPAFDVALNHNNLTAMARSALERTKADYPATPIFLHCFSNGGAFVVRCLHDLISLPATSHDFEGVQIAGVIWDSAPAFISSDSAARAMTGGFRATFARNVAFSILKSTLVACEALNVACGRDPKDSVGSRFWSAMKTIPVASLYIYSRSDVITLAAPLDALVDSRSAALSAPQRRLVFLDTAHVQHMLGHPDEYIEAVRSFISEVLKSKSRPIIGDRSTYVATTLTDSNARPCQCPCSQQLKSDPRCAGVDSVLAEPRL